LASLPQPLHLRRHALPLFATPRHSPQRLAAQRNENSKLRINQMQSVARLKSGTLASASETIQINDTESELEQARFSHQARLFALQQEFNGKRDKLRQEYHERVQEITGDTA
jgi:hypothetical protein